LEALVSDLNALIGLAQDVSWWRVLDRRADDAAGLCVTCKNALSDFIE